MMIPVNLMITLLLFAGIVFLQIFLSNREGRWPGLVLPGIGLLFGLLYLLNMAAPSQGVTFGFIGQVILVWLLGNIPAFVLLAIYFGCREKRRRSKQLDKMNIQDLD